MPPPQTHYDYDIAMSSGGNGSPTLDFAYGVVPPKMGTLNVQGVVDLRHGYCLLQCPRVSRSP